MTPTPTTKPIAKPTTRMIRWACACALAAPIGCGDVGATSAIDAQTACDPTAKFGAVIPVMGLAAAGLVLQAPRLSADELSMYLAAGPSGGDVDLYVASRGMVSEPFGALQPLTEEDSPAADFDPDISSDGLTLLFSSARIRGQGQHLYVASRSTVLGQLGPPDLLAQVNAGDVGVSDGQPFETADGSELWFTSSRMPNLGGLDIWHATRSGAGFASPVMEPGLSSPSEDWFPTLSADKLTIYVSSSRAGKGGFDIWRSHRTSTSAEFPQLALVDELNTAGDDFASWISSDSCRLYGREDNAGTTTIFVATRLP